MVSGRLRLGVRLGAALMALVLTAASSAGLACARRCAPDSASTAELRLTAPGGGHCHEAPAEAPVCRHQQASCDAMDASGPESEVAALAVGASDRAQGITAASVSSAVRLVMLSSMTTDGARPPDDPRRRAPARLPHVLRI